MGILKKVTLTIFIIFMIILSDYKVNTVYAAKFQYIRSGSKDVQCILSVNSTQLQVGISFGFSVNIINAEGAKLVAIKGLGEDKNFEIISSLFYGSSISGNGENAVTQKITDYTAMPMAEGKYSFSILIEYEGKEYQSNEVELNVSKRLKLDEIEKGDSFNFIQETSAADREVYQGQKSVVTYKLYTPHIITSAITFDKLTTEQINMIRNKAIKTNKFTKTQENINGEYYNKYEVSQYFTIFNEPGTNTSPSITLNIGALVRGDTVDNIGFSIIADPFEMNVKALPEEGKPADFNGIVGELNIDAIYNKQTIDYNETATLEIIAYGNCNLDNLDKIIKSNIPGFTVNENLISYNETVKDDKYFATKKLHIVFVPDKTGTITVPAIRVPYFNTLTDTYDYKEISEATIKVKGNKPVDNTQGDFHNSGPSVRIIQINNGNMLKQGIVALRISLKTIYIVIIAMLVLAAAVICITLLKKRTSKDKVLINIYKSLMQTNDMNELFNCFNNMMKHCLNLNLKASSRDYIINRLNEYGDTWPELTGIVLEIMDMMENTASCKEISDIKNKINHIYKKLIKLNKNSCTYIKSEVCREK